MSLITCPECGKIFSDRAAHCPQCGLPTADALKDIAAANGGVVPTVASIDNGQRQATDTANNQGQSGQPATQSAPQPHAQNQQEEFTRQEYDNIPSPTPTPPEKPGRQGSLMVYILIVAVVVLAIVCIAMIATSGSGSSSDYSGEEDSLGTVSTLPADTQPQQTQMIEDIQPEPVPAMEEDEPEFTEDAEPATTDGSAPAEPSTSSSNSPAPTSTPTTTTQHTPTQTTSSPAQTTNHTTPQATHTTPQQ